MDQPPESARRLNRHFFAGTTAALVFTRNCSGTRLRNRNFSNPAYLSPSARFGPIIANEDALRTMLTSSRLDVRRRVRQEGSVAEHFEEVVHVRLRALETSLENEAVAVQQLFDEQGRFITDQFAAQDARWRRDLQAALRQLRDEIRADMVVLLDTQRDALRSEFDVGLDRVRDELRADIQRVQRRLDTRDD
jgi:hypothetical protein